MDLASGRCEGVKKEGCIKNQSTRVYFYVTNIMIGGDLECMYVFNDRERTDCSKKTILGRK